MEFYILLVKEIFLYQKFVWFKHTFYTFSNGGLSDIVLLICFPGLQYGCPSVSWYKNHIGTGILI